MAESDQKALPSIMGIPLKWISLALLVFQMVGMVFVLRVSRTQHVDGLRYLNTTAIFFSEALKFVVSLILHCVTSRDTLQLKADLWQHTAGQPLELLKTCIPSLLYTLQNNLLFVGLSHLPAGLYQVTYQFKILTTAALSVMILGTKLSTVKWFSLFVLTMGVVLVNVSAQQQAHGELQAKTSTFVGLVAVVAACFTSGFAGVYLEKMLKQTTASLWLRNVQLAFFGTIFSLVIVVVDDGESIRKDGFMQGYNWLVWVVIICQAVGGLLIACVMKYADNILKCFGCAVAIIFTCLISVVALHEVQVDSMFIAGTQLVIIATCIYSLGLPGWVTSNLHIPSNLQLPYTLKKKLNYKSLDV